MIELGHVDETRQELEVRALVVEPAQVVVLRVVPATQRLERVHCVRSTVHGAQHASQEFVNTIALLDKRHKTRDAAFVVRRTTEMRKDELLELLDLILQGHQVHDSFVADSSSVKEANQPPAQAYTCPSLSKQALTLRRDYQCS